MRHTPYITVDKSWGRELWLANGPAFCGKVLEINPGDCTSMHYHQRKDEVLYVQQGQLRVHSPDLPGFAVDVWPGECFRVQPGLQHALQNVGAVRLVLFEASSQHLDSDSYRDEEWSPPELKLRY